MISTLIFDFGGVLSRTLFETHTETESALCLPQGSLTWNGPFASADKPDTLWQDMQRQEISERDYWLLRSKEVGALLGEEWQSMETLVQRARGAEPTRIIRPEAIETIQKAKTQGLRLAILSNELDLFYGKALRSRLPLLDEFAAIIDATYTGILKPDPRAYQLCLDALAVRAQECIFIDDQKKNIDGAINIGLPCVHFDVKQPAESFNEIWRLIDQS